MSFCNQCLHWDDDRIDESGLAPCLGMSPKPYQAKVWVTGDFTCPLFKPRQAVATCATVANVSDASLLPDVPVRSGT